MPPSTTNSRRLKGRHRRAFAPVGVCCVVCALAALLFPRGHSAHADDQVSWETRFAAQEAKINRLRAELENYGATPIRLPSSETESGDLITTFAADTALESDVQTRLNRLEREWHDLKKSEADKRVKASEAPTFKMGGQLVLDSIWFSQSPSSRTAVGDLQDAVDFRRARLYASGEAFDVFSYAIGFDFAQGSASNGRPAFVDNWFAIKDLPFLNNVRIGHFFEPFMLERSSSNRNTSFMERSLADAFAPARNVGIMAFDQSEDQSWYWSYGGFRSGSDNFGDDSGDQEGEAADARVCYRPFYDEASGGRSFLHLGAAYSFRNSSDGLMQYRSRPEIFGHSDSEAISTPFFVDTGSLRAHYGQLFGTELYWVHGPFSIQAEYVVSTVNRTNGPDVAFNGGYIYASYFLTGENRTYNRANAIMDRVIPLENFFRVRTQNGAVETGSGAWEITARLSQIDLSDKDVNGGRLIDFTAGLNWYLTPYHRIKCNYILAHLDRFPNNPNNTNIFGIRFDWDF